MPFSNPIVGGTVLIRPAIKSPNFITGVSGWSINKEGSAEFNDVVIRGSVNIGGNSFYYDPSPGLGNLVASIASDDGIDPFGNNYISGIAVYNDDLLGGWIRLAAGVSSKLEYRPTSDPVLYVSGQLNATQGASDRGGVTITSPCTLTNPQQAAISLFGGGPTTSDTSMLVAADRTNFNGDLEVNGDITGNSADISGDVNATGSITGGNMEWGTVQTAAPGAGGGTTMASVGFSKTFPNVPRVFLQVASTADPGTVTIRPYVLNESTTGFDVNNYRSTNSATNIRWWAVSD